MKNTNGKLIGNIEGDSVYCLDLKGLVIGITIKMEDGNFNRIAPIVIRCPKDLGVLSSSEIEALKAFRNSDITNFLDNYVGEINVDFHLDKAEIATAKV
ncbi:asparaginase [Priestia megaterium]|uniref:asparaginase n=1 Tax=Priestia megaterium TaxID=1404 RepID=UPI00366E48EE